MKRPVAFYMLLIMASIFLFFFLNLVLGSVSIPLRAVWNILWGTGNESVIWQNIIWKSRVPQALTALVAGAGLSVSGLQMQTVFRNPLAGPSVLGISSGASMGVAFVVLLSGSLGGVALSKLGFMGEIALTIAAIAGSLSIMALIVFVSQKVRGNVTLLIIGVMIGYIANAVIGVLKFFSVEEDIRAYVIWGLGSFARVSGDQMTLFICIMVVLLPLSFLLVKTLNLLLLGACARLARRRGGTQAAARRAYARRARRGAWQRGHDAGRHRAEERGACARHAPLAAGGRFFLALPGQRAHARRARSDRHRGDGDPARRGARGAARRGHCNRRARLPFPCAPLHERSAL